MSTVNDMLERKDRPAYVRFERRPIEDRAASIREGRFVSKDIDYVMVTPPYSKDIFEQVASDWFAQMRRDVEGGRLPADWFDRYQDGYERWKRGEEMPLHGTPIKGWGVLSPAQQQNLISLHVLTVEDLAAVNDEGQRRIGMGASELRDKARAWLAQITDKGPLTMENAALKAENRDLKAQNELLQARVKELAERVELMQRGAFVMPAAVPAREDGISAADIIEQPQLAPQPKRETLHAKNRS